MKIIPIYPFYPKVARELEAEFEHAKVVEALPGGPQPVIAIKRLPPFACDAILVNEQEFLSAAVIVATNAPGIRFAPMREMLSNALGAPVREVVA